MIQQYFAVYMDWFGINMMAVKSETAWWIRFVHDLQALIQVILKSLFCKFVTSPNNDKPV